MTVSVVFAIAGVLALLIGIIGGGIKAREIEVPTLPSPARVFSLVIGIVLVGAAIWEETSKNPLTIFGSSVPTATAAPTIISNMCDGSDGVYLYRDINYGGACTKLVSDVPNPTGWDVGNDQITSVRIVGNFAVTLYEHAGYLGRSTTLTNDDPDLSDNEIGNDSVSSIKIEKH